MAQTSPSKELSGTINSISLPSLIQILSWEESSSTVSVSAPAGEGNIYFNRGELIDAETIHSRGLDAVLTICTWQNPIMRISSPVTRPRRIQLPVSHIILEASQHVDEQVDHSEAHELTVPPTSFDYAEELALLSEVKDVTQCAIADSKGNILAKSASKLKFESILRYSLLTGKEIKSLLECSEQSYISITTSAPGILYLIPEGDKTLCIHLRKETSPSKTINKVKSAILDAQRQKNPWKP